MYHIDLKGGGKMGEKSINVYKRKDGRYEARYPYGCRDDGNINYKSVYGKTEEETLNNCKQEIKEKLLEMIF